jgi:hypothetical protein
MKSPVFKRLQERNTSAFFNYMTTSVSKYILSTTLGPLNARSKHMDLALRSSSREHHRSSSRGAMSLIGSSEKENNPIVKLTSLGGESTADQSAGFSTMNIKKKISNFDEGMKQDFSKLEDKITRNMKRN